MLGALGFFSAAILLMGFGWTARKLSKSSKSFDSTYFFGAYLSATAAMLCWGLAVIVEDISVNTMVLAGDAFIVLAVLLLTHLAFPKKYRDLITVAVGLASIAALYYRSKNDEAFVSDGLLVFNTPKAFGVFLALALFTIWLRANLNFYKEVTKKRADSSVLRPVYFSANLIGLLSVYSFLFAQKNLTIIFAFSGMLASFLMMLMVNIYLLKAGKMPKSINGK